MKFEIMLRILFDLMSHKCLNATYLAEKYEVSKRTVIRYVNCLEDAGVPIYTIRGVAGGYAIMDTYRINSFMTVKEFEQTINALTSFVTSVPDKTLSSAINKLKCAIRNEYSELSIKSGNLIIDASPWGDTKGYKSKLLILRQSVEDKKQLKITYHDRNGEISERIIDPYVVVFKQGLWYVYAYCHLRNSFRFFKTGRIENATVLPSTFSKKQICDLPLDFWNNAVASETVQFEVDKSVLSDVEEWLGIENVHKVSDKYIANAKLPYDKGLISKIMSFGKGIKVLSPASLIKEIKESALEIYNNYK